MKSLLPVIISTRANIEKASGQKNRSCENERRNDEITEKLMFA